MKIIEATAKSAPRCVNTKYGERLIVDGRGPSGEEITIWFGVPTPEALAKVKHITNGSSFLAGQHSDGKYSLVETPTDRIPQLGFQEPKLPFEAEQKLRNQMAQAKSVAQPSDSRATEIAEYVSKLGKLYAHCYKEAGASLAGTPLEPEKIKDVATTLFIQTIKHFSL